MFPIKIMFCFFPTVHYEESSDNKTTTQKHLSNCLLCLITSKSHYYIIIWRGNPCFLFNHALIKNMPYRESFTQYFDCLFSDGVREKDKDQLGTVLNQVAVAKDNSFTLAKHIYAEVRSDWPFYTDEDRLILKK
jgi:hypothetical protein